MSSRLVRTGPPSAQVKATPREPSGYSKGKIEQILSAARQLFAEQGFSGASMDSVAALAGVGKATVYAHFKNKDELFRAVVMDEGRQPAMALSCANGEDFTAVLKRFADDAFDLLLSPANIATFRTIAAEAARSPHLGQLFYETGPTAIIELLSNFLARCMEKGSIRVGDSRLAATHFLGLICSDLQMRALLGQPIAITPAQKSHLLTQALDIFLRGYAQTKMAATSTDIAASN